MVADRLINILEAVISRGGLITVEEMNEACHLHAKLIELRDEELSEIQGGNQCCLKIVRKETETI